MRGRLYVCMCVRAPVCVCVRARVCVYVYVCVCTRKHVSLFMVFAYVTNVFALRWAKCSNLEKQHRKECIYYDGDDGYYHNDIFTAERKLREVPHTNKQVTRPAFVSLHVLLFFIVLVPQPFIHCHNQHTCGENLHAACICPFKYFVCLYQFVFVFFKPEQR